MGRVVKEVHSGESRVSSPLTTRLGEQESYQPAEPAELYSRRNKTDQGQQYKYQNSRVESEVVHVVLGATS